MVIYASEERQLIIIHNGFKRDARSKEFTQNQDALRHNRTMHGKK